MVQVYADEDGFLTGATGEEQLRDRARRFCQEVARCDEEQLAVIVSDSLWKSAIFRGETLPDLLDGSRPDSPLDPDLRRALLHSLNFKKIAPAPGPRPPGLALATEAARHRASVAYLTATPPDPLASGVVVIGDLVSRARMYRQLEGHEQARRRFFEHLLHTWREEAFGYSILQRLYSRESYRALIEMGEPVVPWLLRELQERPFHWTHALAQITRAQPVQAESKGRLEATVRDWLNWARQKRISW